MVPTLASDFAFRTRRFLQDHWAFRWFVVPVWLMGTALFLLGLLLQATPFEAATLVGMYVAASFGVVLVGLAIERVFAALTGRKAMSEPDPHE